MRSPFRFSLISLVSAVAVSASLALSYQAAGQSAAFPDAIWHRVPDVAGAGWSPDGLKAAREYSKTIPTAAVEIVSGGQVVDEWGETATRYNIHSIRKSILSALY